MKLVIPAVKFAALAPRAFEHFSEAPVAARKHTLQEARLHIVAADFDLAGGHALLQVALFLMKHLNRILRLPLERRKGLWHEGGDADAHLHALALWLIGVLIVSIHHPLGKPGDACHIVERFSGKPSIK